MLAQIGGTMQAAAPAPAGAASGSVSGMPSVLITGASRGLGLELARQYRDDGWRVFASCRTPASATDLAALARGGHLLSVHPLDVTAARSVARLARELAGVPIDLLLNNAGVMGGRGRDGQRFGELDYDDWLAVLATNVLGPCRVLEAFAEQLVASERKLAVTITSRLGSISLNSGGYYAYRSSKAAVNCAMRGAARDLAGRGVVVAVLHPGWVRTDMGGAQAALEPAASVRGLRQVIARLRPQDSGRFFDYSGEELPW